MDNDGAVAAPCVAAFVAEAATHAEQGVSAERALGVMLGSAVGNVLGIPVEFMDPAEIRARYPGGVRDTDPREAHLMPDDDLALTMAVADALLAESDPVSVLADALVQWRDENGRGCGEMTGRAIDLIASGVPPLSAGR